MKVADVHAINMDRLCQDVQADVVARICGTVTDSEGIPPRAVQDDIWKGRFRPQPMPLEDDGMRQYHVQIIISFCFVSNLVICHQGLPYQYKGIDMVSPRLIISPKKLQV